MINRVILIVIDSVGIGSMPDAAEYGDEGSNTLCHVAELNNGLNIPLMKKMGLGNIEGVYNLGNEENPIGSFARLSEQSKGKDTITGHWEIAGIHTKVPFQTYPKGFPEDIIQEFIRKCNITDILGNVVASGTEIIELLGKEHIETKKPIIYTSADSVFQIACHEDVIPLEELYKYCEVAREILRGENEVARIIARPFTGEAGSFQRTSNRRDYSILPDENNMLYKLKESGFEVAAVGKIEDIFAGMGVTQSIHTKDNSDGINQTLKFMKDKFHGLIFTNLVEFDSKWGHRNDFRGYAQGLERFDLELDKIVQQLQDDEILLITADHGCDPTMPGTDHTREYVPLLVYGKHVKKGINMGTRSSFADISATISGIFGLNKMEIGESFLSEIIEVI